MIIGYFIWSSLISLIAILFLYPLRTANRANQIARIYVGALLFPSIIFSLYLVKITLINKTIIYQASRLIMLPFYWGLFINGTNALIIAAINIAVILLVFFLPKRKFAENISLASISYVIIFLITTSLDYFIAISLFSTGSMVLLYAALINENDKININKLTDDFAINRASDLLTILALLNLLIYYQQPLSINNLSLSSDKIDLLSRILFFSATILRVMSLMNSEAFIYSRPNTTIKNLIFYRGFIGIGSQILFLRFSMVPYHHDHLNLYFIITASAVFCYTIIVGFSDKNRSNAAGHLANVLFVSALVSTCLGNYFVTVIIICFSLAIYPVITLVSIVKHASILHTNYPPPPKIISILKQILDNIFRHYPRKFIYLLSKIFTNFLNPIYSGFLLYRLPQMLMAILETPLRTINNGNIQRSLMFVAVILASYLYFWGH
jgi:hypothetical protein